MGKLDLHRSSAKSISKDYVILTFPRSGSHYLRQLIYQNTGVFIEKTHSISEVSGKKVISIVRNPEDSFRSNVAMQKFYSGLSYLGKPIDLSEYDDFYTYLINNSLMLIDYEDLVLKPERVAKAVSYNLNLNYIPAEYKDILTDKPQYEYLVSSKKVKEYDKVDFSNVDFSKSNDIYKQALLKTISV
jgi:HEPN domain-containing protein